MKILPCPVLFVVIFSNISTLLLFRKQVNAFKISTSPPMRSRMTLLKKSWNQQQKFMLSSSFQPTQILLSMSATSKEEDLELTRQIILAHIAKMNRQQDHQDKEEDGDNQTSSSSSRKDDSTLRSQTSYHIPPRPAHDLLLRVALGGESDSTYTQTPVWLFRQAGRHLPEYNAYKKQVQRSFLEMLYHPSDVAECTMQPLRRYDVDAAILFSDILVLPQALGIEITMPGGVGIQVPHPLTSPEDMAQRIPYNLQDMSPSFVQDKLGHVMESITLIRKKMVQENLDKPLIGFSAAPYTLFYYMIGGSTKKNTYIGSYWLEHHPEASRHLLQILTQLVIEYMSAQIEQGAHALQLFEAMGMTVNEKEFDQWCLPCLKDIGDALHSRFGNQVPLMVFARGACHANHKIAQMKTYHVVTIDGSVSRATARDGIPSAVSLQGNYDPAELVEENGKTRESVQRSATQLLEELGPRRLIANLGEGLSGKENPSLVSAFVDTIHQVSEEMIKREK